jgi:hypothetical protein
MATWIIGDIHGCSEELVRLLDHLELGDEDRLVCTGDLFHRGPDPAGVLQLLLESRAEFVLGNHERVLLQRFDLDPLLPNGSDRPPLREQFPELTAAQLRGDGQSECRLGLSQAADLLTFLQGHRGYLLRSQELEGAGLTPEGQAWSVVHAGLLPWKHPEDHSPFELTRTRRLSTADGPWWYQAYQGPELVVFGHSASSVPRTQYHRGSLVALGLDLGCVYGGSLCAYSPELAQLVRVPALRAWAA